MFEYRGLQDVVFIVLYCVAAFSALLAAVYLLWRRGNAFADDVRSSRVLRRWTAAFMAAIVASHVWWYVIGVYWLADDWQVRTITVILLDHATLVPLVMGVLLALLQDRRRRPLRVLRNLHDQRRRDGEGVSGAGHHDGHHRLPRLARGDAAGTGLRWRRWRIKAFAPHGMRFASMAFGQSIQ